MARRPARGAGAAAPQPGVHARSWRPRYETESPQLGDWFEARQADGTFRDDVDALDLGRFASIVLNGFALRVLGGDETDVDVAACAC